MHTLTQYVVNVICVEPLKCLVVLSYTLMELFSVASCFLHPKSKTKIQGSTFVGVILLTHSLIIAF